MFSVVPYVYWQSHCKPQTLQSNKVSEKNTPRKEITKKKRKGQKVARGGL